MAKRTNHPTQGWYIFEDGTKCWVNGFSAHERRIEEEKHGKVIFFERTYYN